MTKTIAKSTNPWFMLSACGVALLGAAFFAATAVQAGECPKDKAVTADGQKPGATSHKGVAEAVLAQIDLSKEKVAVAGHHFRLRKLDIEPGGEVAWHSHTDRPAIIYVVSGTVTEYASTCSVPIVHKAGEVARESVGLSHWWKNTGKTPAVLLSSDIAPDPEAKGM